MLIIPFKFVSLSSHLRSVLICYLNSKNYSLVKNKGFLIVDILIESTKSFEEDIAKLDERDRVAVIEKINHYASLFPDHKAVVYHQLHHLHLPSLPNGYESSLYILRTSPKLRVILAIDEDPIFEQIILTLFRVFKRGDLEKVYKSIANSLYQEFQHKDRSLVKVS